MGDVSKVSMSVSSAVVLTASLLASSWTAASIPSPPRKVKHVPPVYPVESLQAGDEGWVLIELDVDSTGSVKDARILRSSCDRLTGAALTAVRQWRWDTLLINGKPMPWTLTVHTPFRLPARFRARAGRAGACRWTEPPKPIR